MTSLDVVHCVLHSLLSFYVCWLLWDWITLLVVFVECKVALVNWFNLLQNAFSHKAVWHSSLPSNSHPHTKNGCPGNNKLTVNGFHTFLLDWSFTERNEVFFSPLHIESCFSCSCSCLDWSNWAQSWKLAWVPHVLSSYGQYFVVTFLVTFLGELDGCPILGFLLFI